MNALEKGIRRNFQRYTSEQRADAAANFRFHHRQREAVGEVFWTHDAVPNIAFSQRKKAMRAASDALGIPFIK